MEVFIANPSHKAVSMTSWVTPVTVYTSGVCLLHAPCHLLNCGGHIGLSTASVLENTNTLTTLLARAMVQVAAACLLLCILEFTLMNLTGWTEILARAKLQASPAIHTTGSTLGGDRFLRASSPHPTRGSCQVLRTGGQSLDSSAVCPVSVC